MWTRFRDQRALACGRVPASNERFNATPDHPERFTICGRCRAMDHVLTQSELQGLPSEVMLVPLIESYRLTRADPAAPWVCGSYV